MIIVRVPKKAVIDQMKDIAPFAKNVQSLTMLEATKIFISEVNRVLNDERINSFNILISEGNTGDVANVDYVDFSINI